MMKEILDLLHDNNHLTPEQIGVMIGKTADEVRAAIEKMEEERIIVKYTTLINWEKLGDETVTALIDVKVIPRRGSGFDAVAERIYNFPEVKTVYLMSGGYDLSVMVEGKSLKDVAFFVSEKLASLEDVSATTTHFILKKYKQDGVIFEEKEKDYRLVVTP